MTQNAKLQAYKRFRNLFASEEGSVKQPFNFPAYIKFETAKDAKAAIETLRSLYADRCSHVALRKGDNRKVVSFNCANAESAKAIGFLFRHAEYVGYATTAEEREGVSL